MAPPATSIPPTELPSIHEVRAAAGRLHGLVRRTPVLRVDLDGRHLWLKLEQLQVTGSFKARGATNAVQQVQPAPTAVVTASGGNHGLGVAYAAATVGARPIVVVPEPVPEAKARLLDAAGATVHRHGRRYADAEAHARSLARTEGLAFIHPYADRDVIAGQGTVALEVLEDTDCDAVVVAVGGGGLLAGTAVACAGGPVAAVGAEPVGIPTLRSAIAAGVPVDVDVDSITASALGATRTGILNLTAVHAAGARVVPVDDAEVLTARDLLWSSCRLAVEPAAAAGLAAVLAGRVAAARPCVVLCGANSDWTPGQ